MPEISLTRHSTSVMALSLSHFCMSKVMFHPIPGLARYSFLKLSYIQICGCLIKRHAGNPDSLVDIIPAKCQWRRQYHSITHGAHHHTPADGMIAADHANITDRIKQH